MVTSCFETGMTDWRWPSRQISTLYNSTGRTETFVTSLSSSPVTPPLASAVASAVAVACDAFVAAESSAGRAVTIVCPPCSFDSQTGWTRNSPLLSVPSTRSSTANDLVASCVCPDSSRARSERT
jgi:hypothetical protein